MSYGSCGSIIVDTLKIGSGSKEELRAADVGTAADYARTREAALENGQYRWPMFEYDGKSYKVAWCNMTSTEKTMYQDWRKEGRKSGASGSDTRKISELLKVLDPFLKEALSSEDYQVYLEKSSEFRPKSKCCRLVESMSNEELLELLAAAQAALAK